MDETLRHLRAFRESGVSDLVFTPHLFAHQLDRVGIAAELELHRRRFAQVREATVESPDLPRLHLGQEILASQPGDLDDVLGRDDVGMAGGTTLLVEFGFHPPFDAEGVIARVQAEGRRIVVAHAERYRFGAAGGWDRILGWKQAGAALQVNGGSLLGLYTEAAHALGRRLVREGLADAVASDHHGDGRAHGPGVIAEALAEDVDAARVAELLGSGPRALVGLAEPTTGPQAP